MGTGKVSKIGRLVDILMGRVAEVADDEDWKESDGWIGKWTIVGEQNIERVYAIRDGKFHASGEQEEYTGQVEMSEDTFLDLVDAALRGKGEDMFVDKYRKAAIRYRGDQWIVDSERFRKVLRRLSGIPLRSLK